MPTLASDPWAQFPDASRAAPSADPWVQFPDAKPAVAGVQPSSALRPPGFVVDAQRPGAALPPGYAPDAPPAGTRARNAPPGIDADQPHVTIGGIPEIEHGAIGTLLKNDPRDVAKQVMLGGAYGNDND